MTRTDPARPRRSPRRYGNGSDYLSDISRGNRSGFALPKRQFDTASVADGRTGEGEKAFQKNCRPDGDDR